MLVGLYVVAWTQVLVTGNLPLNSSGVPIGGDYVAFHSAARLLVSGQGPAIYDRGALEAVQDDLLGGAVPNFYDAYRNPPFYALLYVPLAGLGLLPAFAIYTLFSLAGLGLALWLLLQESPWLQPRWRGLVIFVCAFPPVYFGVIDGENATLSLLLYVLIYRALRRGDDRAAGIWAALGLFKPQLFFLFPLVFVARRQWRSLVSYAATVAVLTLISLAIVGPMGLQSWLRIIIDLEAGNAMANAWRMASLKSFYDTLLVGQSSLALGLYVMSSVLLLAAVGHLWIERASLPLAWSLTVLSAVLLDPHLIDYDMTVLIAAGIPAWRSMPRVAAWLVVLLYVLVLGRFHIQLGPALLQLSTPTVAALAALVLRQPRPGRTSPSQSGVSSFAVPQYRTGPGVRHESS